MKLNIQLFGSGTIDGSSTATNADCRILWESTTNESDNTSSVKATIQIYKSGSSSTTGTFSGNITINGSSVNVSKKFSPYNWGSWKSVGSVTIVVPHNPDGTKTCSISGRLTQTGTSMAGTYTASDDVTLDTIPRASEVTSVSNGTTNYAPTIKWTPLSNTFKFKIKLKYKNIFWTNSGYITPSTTSEYTYSGITIDTQTAAQVMTTSASDVFTCELSTYDSSDNLIGTTTKDFTVTLNQSVVPTLSVASEEDGDVPSSWGVWVQRKSKVKLTGTATSPYNGTITGYSASGDGYAYEGNPITSNYLMGSGNIPFSMTATDSRGRTKTLFTTLNVEPYSNPTIDIAQIQRCNSDGTINNEGNYCSIVFYGYISSCNGKNTPNAVFRIGYKKTTDSDYTYITLGTNQDNIIATGVLSENGTPILLSNSYEWNIKFEIEDTFTTSTNMQILDTGFDLLNFNASGKSMAIGKVSQASASEETLEVALKAIFDNDIDIKNTSLTLNNEWIMGYKASGDNLSVILPFNNAYKRAVNVDITSAEVYNGDWETITYGGVTAMQTFVKLGFTTTSTLANGNVYLVRITGTIDT